MSATSRPAARRDDAVTGTDIHIVMVPSGSGTAPSPLPHPFSGTITGDTADSVVIAGAAAAVVGSTATNNPAHVPTAPGLSFQTPPANRGTVSGGSSTVLAEGRRLARAGDPVRTCNDPTDADTSAITGGTDRVVVG